VKNKYKRASRNRKRKIEDRLKNENEIRSIPMIDVNNLRFELSEKVSATAYGGIGFINEMVKVLGCTEIY